MGASFTKYHGLNGNQVESLLESHSFNLKLFLFDKWTSFSTKIISGNRNL